MMRSTISKARRMMPSSESSAAMVKTVKRLFQPERMFTARSCTIWLREWLRAVGVGEGECVRIGQVEGKDSRSDQRT